MKNKRFIIATLLVVVATTVAIVSCKKEDQEASQSVSRPAKTFTVPQIDDMNAYLKDFRQRMEESQNDKEAEYLSLEEAAWHLACLANVDFCNVNVKYDDFLFDTIEMQVNTTNGVVLLSDLNMAYEQMRDAIQQYKKEFSRCNQNMYYVNVSIDASGVARIALMTSFMNDSKDVHVWYFADAYVAAVACDSLFSSDSLYNWDGLAASELERIINIFEHQENDTLPEGTLIICYVPTRDHTFDYTNTYDPYGNDYYYLNSSRVFAKKHTQSSLNYALSIFEMCYCLDSYLGLGCDYPNDHLYTDEHPVCWKVKCRNVHLTHMWYYSYHQLHVDFGQLITPNPNPYD